MAGKSEGVVIYHKPTCSTCREAIKILKASGTKYSAVNYYEQPFTVSQLKRLLTRAGLRPTDILRTKEELYKALKLGQQPRSDEELLELLVRHPDLIQRPLVEQGERAILARPVERLKSWLKEG